MPARWRRLIGAVLALMPLASVTPVAAGEDAVEEYAGDASLGPAVSHPIDARAAKWQRGTRAGAACE